MKIYPIGEYIVCDCGNGTNGCSIRGVITGVNSGDYTILMENGTPNFINMEFAKELSKLEKAMK